MAGYTTVNAFFDESGKFRDHDVICFGGVASYSEDLVRFSKEWGRLLHVNGMREFTAKNAFNYRRPLGTRNKAIGVKKRIAALRPFVQCIRTGLSAVTGVTVDVPAFNGLPSKVHEVYARDPIFMAFLRALLHVLDFAPQNDRISFICDDEEQMAIPFYRLFRKVKKIWPGARKKLAAISFADDSVLFGLQAADFVSGLMRLEAGRLWFKKPYHYRSLFKQLSKNPVRGERIWQCDIAFVGKKNLLDVTAGLKEKWVNAISEEKK